MTGRINLVLGALAVTLAAASACGQDVRVVDDFDGGRTWTAHPADGVILDISHESGAMRLDFEFTGGGYAIARLETDLELPGELRLPFPDSKGKRRSTTWSSS